MPKEYTDMHALRKGQPTKIRFIQKLHIAGLCLLVGPSLGGAVSLPTDKLMGPGLDGGIRGGGG